MNENEYMNKIRKMLCRKTKCVIHGYELDKEVDFPCDNCFTFDINGDFQKISWLILEGYFFPSSRKDNLKNLEKQVKQKKMKIR